jgi:hypothetical protein
MREGRLVEMAAEIPAWAATLLEGTGSREE